MIPPPLRRKYILILFQEDGSLCSIFSFDVAANKSRLPMAKNAVRKLRTLRHPGVIKVLDTVEVGIDDGLGWECMADCGIDRNIHLRCDRKAGSSAVAYQAEEHECRNAEMGTIWSRSMPGIFLYKREP